MYTYNTSLRDRPPVTPTMRDGVLSGLSGYPGVNEDVLRSQGAAAQADYALNADKMNADYQLAQQRAVDSLTTQGLGLLANEQANRRSLDQKRMENMRSFTNSLLGGLFG
jgi:hypothetical protein